MEDLNTIFEYRIIPGFRKNSQLLYIDTEKQIYKYKNTIKNVKYYYCYNVKCKAAVAVDFNSVSYCRKILNKVHNHEEQVELYEKLKLINAIKNEVQNAPLKRSSVREIFDEECKKLKTSAQYVEFGAMRRNLLRIKNEKYPKQPTTFEEIVEIFKHEEIKKQFTMSRYDPKENFYIDTIIETNFSYSVFASPSICKSIRNLSTSEERNYIIDGTFNIIPISKNFKQLLIMHIVHANHAYPFIYVLMSTKSEASYLHLFNYLKANVLDLKPNSVITDFESGLRNSVKCVYPGVKLIGCWFHYTNALRRKVSKIPYFRTQLNTNKEFKNLFSKFMYLPLLRPANIVSAYQELEREAMAEKYFKENTTESIFRPFISYFNRQWMKKVKPENFTVYKEPIRTSNSAESFHSRLNSKLPKRGNFFKFLDMLLEMDSEKSIDFLKSNSGCSSLYRKREPINYRRDRFIQNQLSLLKQKKINLMEILTQFSNMNNCLIAENYINEIHTSDDDDDDDNDENIEASGEHELMNKMNNSLQTQSLLCIICCDRERELLFNPCKHFKICTHCYEHMKNTNDSLGRKTLCPVCRAIIIDVQSIFF